MQLLSALVFQQKEVPLIWTDAQADRIIIGHSTGQAKFLCSGPDLDMHNVIVKKRRISIDKDLQPNTNVLTLWFYLVGKFISSKAGRKVAHFL